MICEILTSSVLILAPVVGAHFNTVDYVDGKIRLTERVLDRSVCKDLEYIQQPNQLLMKEPSTTEAQKAAMREKAEIEGKRNAIALSKHCKASGRVSAKDKNECNLLKSLAR